MTRTRWGAAGAVGAALVALAGGCSASDGDDASLCTTGAPVPIVGVTVARGSGGLRVTSWGTRHVDPEADPGDQIPMYGPGLVGSLSGFGTGRPVSSRCAGRGSGRDDQPGEDDPVDQFAVSVAAGTPRATMAGVTVRYASGRTTFAQFAFVLCSTHRCPPA